MNIEDKAMEFAITETRKMMEKDGVPKADQDRILAGAIATTKAAEASGDDPAGQAATGMLNTSRGNINWKNLTRVDLQEAYVLFASMITAIKTLDRMGKEDDNELLVKILLSLLSKTMDNMKEGV